MWPGPELEARRARGAPTHERQIPNPLHRRKSVAVALLVDMERNLFCGSVDDVEYLSAFLLEFRDLLDFVLLRDIHDSPIQFANTDSVLLRV